ncbi:Ltp family lipoprotein [Arthrobacter sp. Rue61a]|uniref:Ltp family lipoprotein n=1 Tax=Arthrobacter sp. Rue61a TaxID=1118963 RepID=UPI0005B77BBB|nr:Ltp family lipoprotein [Arthrobacter sp. Rue61a]
MESGQLSRSHTMLTNIELMGEQLNKFFPATITVAVLALTGCGGGGSEAPAEPTPETTKAVFSADQTCDQLFDKGDEGRMFGAVAFLQNLPDPVTENDQTKAKTIVADLEYVAGTANDEMKPLIIDMAKTLDGFASAEGAKVHVNVDSFKSAGSKLIDLCPTQAEAYGDEKLKKEAAVKAKADADAAAETKAEADAAAKAKAAADAAAAKAAADAEAAAKAGTVSQQNARGKAASYLKFSAFSRTGLIGQLEYNKFSTADATWAVDTMKVDWNEQAAKKAASYLKFSSFSRSGLVDQLIYNGFTPEQAEYGVSTTGL